MEVVYIYLCIPGRMIYPKLPEIDEELIKLKHFEAIHDLCSLTSEKPLSIIKELLSPDEVRRLRLRGELIVDNPLRLGKVLNGEPLIKGEYAVLRLKKVFPCLNQP